MHNCLKEFIGQQDVHPPLMPSDKAWFCTYHKFLSLSTMFSWHVQMTRSCHHHRLDSELAPTSSSKWHMLCKNLIIPLWGAWHFHCSLPLGEALLYLGETIRWTCTWTLQRLYLDLTVKTCLNLEKYKNITLNPHDNFGVLMKGENFKKVSERPKFSFHRAGIQKSWFDEKYCCVKAHVLTHKKGA